MYFPVRMDVQSRIIGLHQFLSDAIAHATSPSFIKVTRLGKHTTVLYNSSSAIGCALLHFGNGLMVKKFLNGCIINSIDYLI